MLGLTIAIALAPQSVSALDATSTTGVAPFSGYEKAVPFTVVPRKDKLTFYPCMQCHEFMPTNPAPRKLAAPPPHPSELKHGEGRLWCLVCHHSEDRNRLRTLRDEKVDFNDAYLICGQCHANRQKDWYFGGHGKRVADWQGVRVLYICTHCHNPHNPKIQPRKPKPAPPVRAALSPAQPTTGDNHRRQRVWERYAGETTEIHHAPGPNRTKGKVAE